MRIFTAVAIVLLSVYDVNGISNTPTPATLKGDSKDLGEKRSPIGTSKIEKINEKKDSISSFKSSVKAEKISNTLRQKEIEEKLLKSMKNDEIIEEKNEKRVNFGHNKSTKINVKKDVKIKITVPKKKVKSEMNINAEVDEGLNDDEDKKKIATQQQTQTVQRQILMSGIYMLSSRFILKLDFEDSKIIKLCRVVFAVYLLSLQLMFYFIKRKIELDDDSTEVDTPVPFSLDTLKGKIPALANLGPIADILTAQAPATPPPTKITVKEYDLSKLSELSNSLYFEILTVSYLHFAKKGLKPLLFIPLMGYMNKCTNPLVNIHLFGAKAIGLLKRPFTSSIENMIKDLGAGANNSDISNVDSSDSNSDGGGDVPEVIDGEDETDDQDDEDDDENDETDVEAEVEVEDNDELEVEDEVEDEVEIEEEGEDDGEDDEDNI
mmetsp:Transcript_34285/g.32679  ORF Transcript_34285/g.32679 Transcript_34285/m.32679 type:complete len:436 (+) Transcript_34285:58-1365(+)